MASSSSAAADHSSSSSSSAFFTLTSETIEESIDHLPSINSSESSQPSNLPETAGNSSPSLSSSNSEETTIFFDEKLSTEENGEDGEEEEEEEECGFCIFMKAGGCKDPFVAWEKCVEEAEKTGEDVVNKCMEATSLLKQCMEEHSNYYDPILRAEKEMADATSEEQMEKGPIKEEDTP